jgi:hypothetical protein
VSERGTSTLFAPRTVARRLVLARALACPLGQVLERCVRRGEYAALLPDAQLRFRMVLMGLVVRAQDALAREEQYVVTRVAVLVGLLIQVDYPRSWPTAFDELLAMVDGSAEQVDLLLRVLNVVDEEVVQATTSTDDGPVRAANQAIKDVMRASGVVARLTDFWFRTLQRYSAGGLPPALGVATFETMRRYIGWIDVNLVVNPQYVAFVLVPGCGASGPVLARCMAGAAAVDVAQLCAVNPHPNSWPFLPCACSTVPLLMEYLSQPITRLGACGCLYEVVNKGMDDNARVRLIATLRLVDVIRSFKLDFSRPEDKRVCRAEVECGSALLWPCSGLQVGLWGSHAGQLFTAWCPCLGALGA